VARPDVFNLVYLDSNVFIRYMTRDRGWEVVDRLLYAAEARQFELLTFHICDVRCG
jgi:predicted nucleic acid-binding protein